MLPGGHLTPRAGDWLLGCRLDARLSARPGSTVWRAWRPSDARDVALRIVPRSEVDPLVARHLRRRGQLLAALAPPHAAEVLDAGELGDHLVLVSRLAPGTDLEHRVRRDRWWTPAQAVLVVSQIATCLDAVHRAGVVHGALTPRNVRVTGTGESMRATVVELGLPRVIRQHEHDPSCDQMQLPGLRLTAEPARSGVPDPFRAPEVRAGEEPTVASDVHGLAALLHLLVTGASPGRAPLVPSRLHDERSRLLAVARLGLGEQPADRPSSVLALADAAAMALDERPRTRGLQRTESGRPTEQPVITRIPLEDGEGLERTDEPAEKAVDEVVEKPLARSVAPLALAPPRRGPLPAPRGPVAVPPVALRADVVDDVSAVDDVVEERPERRGSRIAALAALVVVALLAQVGAVLWAARDDGAQAEVAAPTAGASPAAAAEEIGAGGPSEAPAVSEPGVGEPGVGEPEAGEPQVSEAEVVPSESEPSWGVVRPGVIGPQVTAIQWLLFANGAGPAPDGVYDAATAQRIADFQIAAGIPVTGIVDARTWSALATPVAPGDQGPRVRALQQLLRVERAVAVDGAYDGRTSRVVAAFQRDSGVDLSGAADVATWAALSRAWD